MDTKEFLKAIHGNDIVNFRFIKKGEYPKNLSGKYNEKTEERIKKFNEEGFNVYFVVNGGGTHSYEINKINAVYVDFDCGKDENKKYFPLEVTKEYKDKCIEKVSKFKHQPTCIVETRNGIHCYWTVNEGATVEQFLECQLRLIQYFDSDKAVKTPERVMRLPGYDWTKDIDNRFMCNVIESYGERYDIKEILESLPEVIANVDTAPTNRNSSKSTVSFSGRGILPDNIQYIRRKDIKALQAIVNATPVEFSNHEDVFAYLKRQDLNQFLGLPKKFNCIFHKDNNPSADIFSDPSTAYYWYKCHSEKCGVVKDIISITENLLNCTTPKACNFLRSVYQITYKESEWQKEQRELLDANNRLLIDTERFRAIAPETYKRVSPYLSDLSVLMNYARERVYTENFTDLKGLPVFFVSQSYLEEIFYHKDHKRINNMLSILTYLGLINKLSEDDIPEFLLKQAKHHAARKKQQNIISFYSIPLYCDEILTFSENKSVEFKEMGLTVRGMSRELIFRTLGEEEADRIYPQLRGKELTGNSIEFALEVKKFIEELINAQEYTTEGQLLLCLKGNKEVLKSRLKRVIPEILDDSGLVRVKLNKSVKENLEIDGNGYPHIIIAEDNFSFYSYTRKVWVKDMNTLFNSVKEENIPKLIAMFEESLKVVA